MRLAKVNRFGAQFILGPGIIGAIRAELAECANHGSPMRPAACVFEDLRTHHQSHEAPAGV